MLRVPYQQLDSFPGEYGCTTLHNEPFTGIAYSEHEDGATASEWNLRQGELWGPHYVWHPDGKAASSTYFVAGIAHGASRSWYHNGQELGVEFIQYGRLLRARSFDAEGRIWRDYTVGCSQPDEATEQCRKRYGPLIDAENIPAEFLNIADGEWQEKCARFSYRRAHVMELDAPPSLSAAVMLGGSPFTGVAFETRSDGVVEREWVLRDGLLWGMQRGWKNGMSWASAGYAVAGMKHGAWREWWADCQGQPILSLEWHQFGMLIRAKKWNFDRIVTQDYRIEADPRSAKLLADMEDRRARFADLIRTEHIPKRFLRIAEREWESA